MNRTSLVARFRRLSPVAVDGLLAVALLAIDLTAFLTVPRPECGCVKDSDALGVAILALGNVPIAWRRRFPIAVLFLTFAALTSHEAIDFPEAPILSPYFAIYTVGASRERRPSAIAAGTAVSVYLAAYVSGVLRHETPPISLASNFLFVTAFWVLGISVRTVRAYATELEDRAGRLEREQEERARRAAVDERGRIARELHDVVAHNVSVMVLQAGGARRVLDSRPERTREALNSIERTGRQALTEMRRLLGVLRQEDEGNGPLEPPPGIDRLDNLVSQIGEAGLPVDVLLEGHPRPLPVGLDVSVYRIIQEALTNALRHAGPARAKVLVRYGDHDLQVRVTDDGRGIPGSGGDGSSGQGLIGMRERVALFGGEFEAGPTPGGGYAVSVRLPIEATSG